MEPNNFVPQNNPQVPPVNPGFIPKPDPAPVAPPTPVTQPPQPIPTQAIAPTTATSHTGLWILALVITAVVFGGVGYFIPKSEKVSVAAVNDMSDWQTYKNDYYGFELKYPNDFRLVGPGCLATISGQECAAANIITSTSSVVNIVKSNSDESLEILLIPKDQNTPDLKRWVSRVIYGEEVTSSENTEIGEHEAVKIITAQKYSPTQGTSKLVDSSTIGINLDNYILQITQTDSSLVLNQILSTFKFTSATSSVATSASCSDYTCLIAASQTCSPASAIIPYSLQLGSLTLTGTNSYKISAASQGQCNLIQTSEEDTSGTSTTLNCDAPPTIISGYLTDIKNKVDLDITVTSVSGVSTQTFTTSVGELVCKTS